MLSAFFIETAEEELIACYNKFTRGNISSLDQLSEEGQVKFNGANDELFLRRGLVSLYKKLKACVDDSSFFQLLTETEKGIYATEFRFKYEGMMSSYDSIQFAIRASIVKIMAKLSPQEEKKVEDALFSKDEAEYIARQSHAILHAGMSDNNQNRAFWDLVKNTPFFKRCGGKLAFEVTPSSHHAPSWTNCKIEDRAVIISWCDLVLGESERSSRNFNWGYHHLEAIRSTLKKFADEDQLQKIMQKIIRQFPQEKTRIDKKEDEARFLVSAVRGDESVFKAYLDKYENSPEAMNVLSSNGTNAFTRALVNRHLNLCKMLLERGFDNVNSLNYQGLSPLAYCAKEKVWVAVAWLLKLEKDLQIDDFTVKAIHTSEQPGLIELLQSRLTKWEEMKKDSGASHSPGGSVLNRYRQFSPKSAPLLVGSIELEPVKPESAPSPH